MRRSATVSALLLSACATAPPPATPGITRAEAEAVLTAQAAQWNRGDLPGFVATYFDGDALTFLGAGGLTRGRADLLANYQRAYDTPAKRGTLRFQVLDFLPLGRDFALLLGRYDLDRSAPDHGFFSLLLTRQDGRLVILHDHTSSSR